MEYYKKFYTYKLGNSNEFFFFFAMEHYLVTKGNTDTCHRMDEP